MARKAVANKHPGGANSTILTTSFVNVLTLYSPTALSDGKLCIERWSMAAMSVNVVKSIDSTVPTGTHAVDIQLVKNEGLASQKILRTYRFDLSQIAETVSGDVVTSLSGSELRKFIVLSEVDSEIRLADGNDEGAFIGAVPLTFSEISDKSAPSEPVGGLKLPLVLLDGENLKIQMKIGTTKDFGATVRGDSVGIAVEEVA